MELLYVWIKEYKNIHEQGFNFSPAWRFKYEPQNGTLEINDRRDQTINGFFGRDISNVTAIVGENGSGKSNLLEFLLRLFDRGTGFWNEPFIAIFWFDNRIRVWHFADLIVKVLSTTGDSFIDMIPFKMRETADGIRGGARGENEIDNVKFAYYSQYVDGLKRGFGMSRNDNFFDMSNFRYMVQKVPDEKGEREEFISPNKYYLNDARRQSLFLGAGGQSLIDFPVPHYLKITVNKEVNLDYLTRIISGKGNPLATNYGADEIWKFLDQPDFLSKAFRALLFSAIVDATAMSIKGAEYIEGIKHKIQNYPTNEDPLNLLEGVGNGYMAPFNEIHRLVQWMSKECQSYIQNQPIDRIVHTRDAALIIPTDTSQLKEFFNFLDTIDIQLSLPFNFSWTFQDEPDWPGGLSTGHTQLINFFSRIYSARTRFISTHSLLFFIDEGEAGLHPELQKQYIHMLVSGIPQMLIRTFGENKAIQIILTSHSPFILSDLPRENVIFLETNKSDGKCSVSDGLRDMKQTFGANIHTILSDAFFLRRHEGLMGKFAKARIDQVIRFYQEDEMINNMDAANSETFAEKIIAWVGEPIIKRYLLQLQNSKKQKRLIQEIEVLKAENIQLKKTLADD